MEKPVLQEPSNPDFMPPIGDIMPPMDGEESTDDKEVNSKSN